jgi:hypothetical protein
MQKDPTSETRENEREKLMPGGPASWMQLLAL